MPYRRYRTHHTSFWNFNELLKLFTKMMIIKLFLQRYMRVYNQEGNSSLERIKRSSILFNNSSPDPSYLTSDEAETYFDSTNGGIDTGEDDSSCGFSIFDSLGGGLWIKLCFFVLCEPRKIVVDFLIM